MKYGLASLAGLAALAIGCAAPTPAVAPAVDVSGTVTTGGRPVSDVILTFQPTEVGLPNSTPLPADGKFSVKLVPGKYVWKLVPVEDAKKVPAARAKEAYAKVPETYRDTSMDRQVTVSSGSTLDLKAD